MTKLPKCLEEICIMQHIKKGKYETSGFLCTTLQLGLFWHTPYIEYLTIMKPKQLAIFMVFNDSF